MMFTSPRAFKLPLLPYGQTFVYNAVSATSGDHLKGVGTALPRIFTSSPIFSWAEVVVGAIRGV